MPSQRAGCSSSCVCRSTGAGAAPLPTSGDSDDGSSLRNAFAVVRAVLFYTWTFTIALPFFCLMMAIFPFVMLLDKAKRRAEHFINNIWATLSTSPFYRVDIEGAENLPADDEAAVYVSNHESFLDIYSLFHLKRGFKFISKTSNFLIPIVGWSMFMTGHVMINRMDRRSQMNCLNECKDLLGEGASVLFFPEGTRTSTGRMAPFKKGAFSVAVKTNRPVVPITLLGTGDLMPNSKEGMLFPGRVKIIVHPPIATADTKDAGAVMAATQSVIASSLPAWKTADL